MSNYIFAYHSGKEHEDPEGGMARWKAWVSRFADAFVSPGTPLKKSKTVSSERVTDGGGVNPLMGFSIVKADSMDAALEMAKCCPHLEIGTIEVAEMLEM